MEFWEKAFIEKKSMWGDAPAHSARIALELFRQHQIKSVLIPGFGYGRNAKEFLEHGIEVTGIEISATAIDLAHQQLGDSFIVHHGSVTDMPFDQVKYDAVFCHGLIYLLDESERAKLIHDCFTQLKDGGLMLFSLISQKAQTYGQGTPIGEHRFEMFGGVRIYFYDQTSIKKEFSTYGIINIIEVEEDYPFYLVQCQKTK